MIRSETAENEIHVVLDQQDSHPHALELADDHCERTDFLRDQTSRWLVQQQYTRFNCERAGDFDQSAMPIGQRRRGSLCEM